MSEKELDILLVEDNPGDARLIEEMLTDAEELLRSVDPGESTAGVPRLQYEQRMSDALEYLSDDDVDVILLDLNLPDSTGLDTVDTMDTATDLTPIVVLTGLDDQEIGIQAIQHGAQDYLVKDEVSGAVLARSIHHAVERTRQERERLRRRQQLETLNRLNRIGQDIAHSVITTSTREELERAVCERLVESDAYRFAWIGAVDRGTDRVTPRVAAGVEEGYLDDISIRVGDDETAKGPTGKSIQTETVQVVRNIQTDPEYEPWREKAIERGYRSSAAIPIVYENLRYGVLNVYSSSPDAFSESETDILGRLGDVIGHAIAAIERRDALVSDTLLELEFQVEGIVDELVALSAEHSCRILIDNLVHSDDALLAYGTVGGVTRERFSAAASRSDSIEDFQILSSESDEYEVELVTGEANSLVEAVATHGGRIRAATIEDGEFRFVVEFPPGRDTRQLIELVEGHCNRATLFAQRTVERPQDDVSDLHSVLEEQLTEKQRTALETAYFTGHFDWPRVTTGEEVADRLGITPSTFAQHLRTAERKFFDAVFDDKPPEE